MPKKENLLGNPTLSADAKKLSPQQIRIQEISQHGIAAKGQALLVKNIQGKRLSASLAALAKCYDCMSYYEDGKGDCGDPICPLYPWMPYGQKARANRALPEKKSEPLVCSYPPQSGNTQGDGLP